MRRAGLGILLALVAIFIWRMREHAYAPSMTPASGGISAGAANRTDQSSRSAVNRPSGSQAAVTSLDPPDPIPADLRGFEARFERLASCAEGGCNYPETDPHSYDFALNRDVAKTLDHTRDWILRENIFNSERVSEIARAYLESSDGFVQEAAIDVIATQPPSPANLNAILEGVLAGSDPDLVEKGITELKRYHAAEDLTLIDQAFGRTLTSGAPFIAEQVSLRLAPFLNPSNEAFYRDILSQLGEDSIYRINLESALGKIAR